MEEVIEKLLCSLANGYTGKLKMSSEDRGVYFFRTLKNIDDVIGAVDSCGKNE